MKLGDFVAGLYEGMRCSNQKCDVEFVHLRSSRHLPYLEGELCYRCGSPMEIVTNATLLTQMVANQVKARKR